METNLKDAVSLANVTRKDVHDGFRTLLANSMASSTSHSHNNHNSNSYNGRNYNSGGSRSTNPQTGGSGISSSSISSGSSSELMSAVIVEALASVDTMSTALGRKITEFSRSMDERLEIVSMSINGFLESCVRVQDNEPLLEERIADLLMLILGTVDNSTRTASELWLSVAKQIVDDQRNMTRHLNLNGISPSCPAGARVPDLDVTDTDADINVASGISLDSGSSESPIGNEVLMVRGESEDSQYHSPHILSGSQTQIREDENDDDDTDTDSLEEESQSPTVVPDRNSNRRRQGQQKRPSPSRRRPIPPRADGETLSEEDKKSLWESLKVLSSST